jgi:hypothetical protein
LPPVSATSRSRTSCAKRAVAAVEHGASRLGVQAADPELRQPERVEAGIVVAVAGREQQRDRLGRQAAGDERQHVGGRVVEPLRVVDDAQQRAAAGGLAEQAQHRERDEEPLRPAERIEPQRAAQRARLQRRDRVGVREHRPQELLQRPERELCLGLDRAAREEPHAARAVARGLQQRRLPDAGLPAEYEHPAAGLPGCFD